MSRDYKPNRHSSRERESTSGGGAFKGILYGLVLGLVIAAAVAWWFNRMPSPFIDKTATPATPAKAGAAAPTPAAGSATPATPVAPAPVNAQSENGQPIPLPGKPGETVPEKRFQFPDILSGKTDGTTPAAKQTADSSTAKAAASAPAAEVPPAGFYLMAGSFQKQSDAEAQKANLALQGFDASIQKAVIGEKVWFRVKIGPFKRQDDANRARNDLKENGIEAVPARN
ncbi:MAG: SPOR domain-containing protein [Fluviibacter sp.]